MVVDLQALAMMAEVLNARLERNSQPTSDLQARVGKLNRLAREALTNCLKVVAWIQPVGDEIVRLPHGIAECLSLLASNFNFRGFTVTTDLAETDFEVSRSAFRYLLCGCLITLTDAATGACDVLVKAQVRSAFAEITIRVTSKPNANAMAYEPGYRQLDWADVQAIAMAERVELARSSGQIVMRVPRAFATTPLQSVPLQSALG